MASGAVQILLLLPLILYILLVVFALRHLRRQNLTERELLIWDVLVVFTGIGAFAVFFMFPPGRDGNKY